MTLADATGVFDAFQTLVRNSCSAGLIPFAVWWAERRCREPCRGVSVAKSVYRRACQHIAVNSTELSMNMSMSNSTGYCPYCKQNVLMVREAVNWALVIVLIIFTGGIGLIVYAIIYFNKVPNYCIHCRSKITSTSTNNAKSLSQSQYTTQIRPKSEKNVPDSLENGKAQQQKFCSFCGELIINREAQFCAHCGSKV